MKVSLFAPPNRYTIRSTVRETSRQASGIVDKFPGPMFPILTQKSAKVAINPAKREGEPALPEPGISQEILGRVQEVHTCEADGGTGRNRAGIATGTAPARNTTAHQRVEEP